MDAKEVQKELIQFLLARLKACAIESQSFHGVFLNFPEGGRAQALELLEFYRQSTTIREKVESQFHDLDLLIQQVGEGVHNEEWRKLLGRFDPSGPLN
jgi:hypothetical protein